MARGRPQPTASVQAETAFDNEHTPEQPYCKRPIGSCWCHTNVEYHDLVTSSSIGDEFDSDLYDRALSFLSGTS